MTGCGADCSAAAAGRLDFSHWWLLETKSFFQAAGLEKVVAGDDHLSGLPLAASSCDAGAQSVFGGAELPRCGLRRRYLVSETSVVCRAVQARSLES